MGVDHLNQTAEIGLFIGNPEDKGKGYGQETVKLLVDYGFRYLNLKNIMLKVFSGNERAIHTYQKCGFREFGRRTRCLYVDNQWNDEIYMEIMKNDRHMCDWKKIALSFCYYDKVCSCTW